MIDALEADLTPPMPSTVPASVGMLLQLGLPSVVPMSEPGPTQWGSGAEFSLESGDPEFNSESQLGIGSREERAFVPMGSVVPLSRGRFQALSREEEFEREEVPIQDDQDRVFDMTVADSLDEVDIEVAQPVRDVPRGRRVVLVPQSGTPRSVHNRSDAGENESDTDSLDFSEENGSVVSGVEEPP